MPMKNDTDASENWKPKILALCCRWCTYEGADLAGLNRMQYPADVRILRVPCSGMAEALVEVGKRCSPTKSVLAEWARRGTPRQVESLLSYPKAEAQGRDASKRASLLRRCALPALRTFDGHDRGSVSWPRELGRDDLLPLSLMHGEEDLASMGDVGCGKAHMACALCAMCCGAKIGARFLTASSLVMRLRRANDDGRLGRELAQIGRSDLLVIDELGFLPLDAEGARLLFQAISQAYGTQSVVLAANLEFSRRGRHSGTTRWLQRSSTGWFTTAAFCASGENPIA